MIEEGIDTLVLQIVREREQFDKLILSLPMHAFEEKTQVILKDFKEYYKEFPEHKTVDPDTFSTWFFSFRHPKLVTETKQYYKKLLHKICTGKVDEDTKKGIMARILELQFATNVGNLIAEYQSGADMDIQRAIEEASDNLKAQLDKKIKIPWVKNDIHALLLEDKDKSGLTWRLRCLNESMRPLRPGDFGLIAGRPEAGKTSLICSEVTNFARQLEKYYGDNRPVIWFNNEGPGNRIYKRLYQAALNCSVSDLIKKQKAGTVEKEYRDAIGGSIDNIRVMDIHDMWNYDIIDILNATQPGLVIFDMIDNIKFCSVQGGAARTDQVLESMYQWARILGVRYNVPIIATSQISYDGDGLQFPTMGMLKDSKTGKQGTLDFQIMIGKSNEVGMENSRFIGLVRNKLHQEGFPKDPQQEVFFDALRARYTQPGE